MRTAALTVATLLVCWDLPAQPQAPVFRGGVEVIEVDVNVLDNDGRPLADLRGPEFAVTIDGQPRTVVSAEFISQQQPPAGEPAPAVEPADTFYTSNTAGLPGRLIILAVDHESISFGEGRHVMRAAADFLETLSPPDKVAFFTVPQPGPIVDFTSNRDLVRQALERTVGLAGRPQRELNIGVYEAYAVVQHSDPLVEAAVLARFCGHLRPGQFGYEECVAAVRADATAIVEQVRHQVTSSLRSLEQLLNALRDIEGAKSLVLITEGLVIDGTGGELTSIERAAAASRTSIHIIMLDPPLVDMRTRERPPSPREDRQLQERGLQLMAARTRGGLFRVSQRAEPIFARIAEELSGYYLLGVEAAPSDHDGQPHAIAVSVRRRGAHVRARREFLLAPAAAAAEGLEDRLRRTLRSPFTTGELPMRLATYAYHDPDSSKVRVLIATEISREYAEPPELAVGYVLLDGSGTVIADRLLRATLRPVEGANGAVLQHLASLLVDPGSYTLKLAVVDPDGRRGSIEHRLQAWQMSDVPFAVGDLLVGDPPSLLSGLRPTVEPRLSSGRLAAYLELYASDASFLDAAQVRVEVVGATGGSPRAAGTGAVRSDGDGRRRSVSTLVPVHMLPPGQYVARAIVSREGEPLAELARPFYLASTPARAATADGPAAAADPPVAADVAPGPLTLTLLPPPAFQRDDVLRSEVVAAFLDILERGRPGLKPVVAQVRRGRLTGAGRHAFEIGDQMAAAFLRGLELLASNDASGAATQFVAALRVTPDFAPASFYLGACYAATGRDREAATALRRALIAADKMPVMYALLADVLQRLDEAPHAVPPLSEAVSAWPDDDSLRRRLGVAYALSGRHADALQTIEPFLARHPADHEALLIALHGIVVSVVRQEPGFEPDEAQRRMHTYADAYTSAQGPHQALVTAWTQRVEGR